jgi:uncharacterized Fe-S cluster-containing MiaB family protein
LVTTLIYTLVLKMKNEYYPYSREICHHFYNNGGCTFCGYKTQKRSVSPRELSMDEMIAHFDDFAQKNISDIKKSGRLIIAPNGSWFTQVHPALRKHIYDFIEANSIPMLKYECRATLFNPDRARKELEIMHRARYGSAADVEKGLQALAKGLGEIKPSHMISLGLEVADDQDLEKLNKGCCLDDYVFASGKIMAKDAKLGCNILIAPPGIENPAYKAFATARFAVEELGASELLIMPCTPMRGTPGYDDWVNARWNPISATAASEIFRTIKNNYSSVKVRYLDLRVFSKHGRHGKFRRKPGKWSEEEKEAERGKIRKIANSFFRCGKELC